MKVKELIDILSKEDGEKEVFVSYDSFCCQYHLENIIEVFDDKQNPHWKGAPGIHLLAMNSDHALWHLGMLERELNNRPMSGRVISLEKDEE
jgi:hypothetical protein